jgi:hexosaminidase
LEKGRAFYFATSSKCLHRKLSNRCPEEHNMREYLSNGKKPINVKIEFSGSARGLLPQGFNRDYEQYNLTVNVDGNIKIAADHYPGVIRGLDTLSQLIERNEKDSSEYHIKFAPFQISDHPSFAYRGVMLDTSREYYFPDTIKLILDGMMLSRLNVFHWHFIDTDSIPMFFESFSGMTNSTAFSQKEIYTPEMVKDIVKYAKIRGIKVVPELEGPGHLNALGHFEPFKHLIGCYREPIVGSMPYGVPPNSPIDPTEEKTYAILEKFFLDLHKNFDSDFWHLGGDEVEVQCWSNMPSITSFLQNSEYELKDLQNYYMQREKKLLREKLPNAQAGYWYQSDKLNYDKDDVLQYWGKTGSIRDQMKNKPDNMFILSPHDSYYLD